MRNSKSEIGEWVSVRIKVRTVKSAKTSHYDREYIERWSVLAERGEKGSGPSKLGVDE